MEERKPIIIQDFLGLKTRVSQLDIPVNASPVFTNIELLKQGMVVRPGYDNLNTLTAGTNPITGIFDGFNHVLISHGANVDSLSGSTLTNRKTGLTSNAVPAWASYNALDMMVNGSANDNPQSWDGTTWQDLSGSPPKADDIEVWRNHVWLTGLASPNQGEVRFSELELPTVWPSGHFLRPTKREKGAQLICSKVCPFPGEEDGTRLVSFAQDRIYHFDGFNKALFQIFTAQNKGIGSISKRGHVNAEGIHYWVGPNGIYATDNGGYSVNNISWDIQPTFDAIGKTVLPYACAAHYRDKRQIWWTFVTPQSQQTTVLIYNYGLSTPMANPQSEGARHCWSFYTLRFCTVAEVYDSAAGKYKIYGGEADGTNVGGFVYEVGALQSDNGDSKSVVYETPIIVPGGTFSNNNVIRKITAVYDSATADAGPVTNIYLNGSDVTANTGAFEISAGTSIKQSELWLNYQAASFKLKITFSPILTNWRVLKLIMEVKPMRGTK